jgi:hypothetical protein
MVFPKLGQDVLFELGGVVFDDDLDGYKYIVIISHIISTSSSVSAGRAQVDIARRPGGGLACDHIVDLTRWGLDDELRCEVVSLVGG